MTKSTLDLVYEALSEAHINGMNNSSFMDRICLNCGKRFGDHPDSEELFCDYDPPSIYRNRMRKFVWVGPENNGKSMNNIKRNSKTSIEVCKNKMNGDTL